MISNAVHYPAKCHNETSAAPVNPGVTRATALLLACVLCSSLAGQEINGAVKPRYAAEQDSLEWAVALGNRFRELHDPVVAAYSLGVLGGIVCPVDPAAATDIYRESLEDHSCRVHIGTAPPARCRCTCEVVDTGRGRHNFNLKVPGVTMLTLSELLRNASGVDPERLESVLIGLQDEERHAVTMPM